jgi:formamidopyrimidine-DNA glycosylase
VPELPEVEITARRLDRALRGAEVETALAPGVVAMKTFDPPLDALGGRALTAIRRAGKMLVVEAGELSLLVHLMSAGRLQLFEGRASVRDRTARVLVRLRDGRELRLREFGTQQRAWAKLLRSDEVARDEQVATLGPDAHPAPPADRFAALVDQPRHLHGLLRDQRTIAGIGRAWVDEILWTARLSAFRKGSELDEESVERLRGACDEVLGGALEHYERVVGDTVPDKAPMPLQVHARQGQPCPRCGTPIERAILAGRGTWFCPHCQPLP